MVIQQKASGFRSIRHRILVFSVLVTLVPSFGMGWYFYDMIYRTTTEKTELEADGCCRCCGAGNQSVVQRTGS